MDQWILKVDNVSKQYRLGQIGGTTLRDELQRLSAKLRGKDDPTKQIGTRTYTNGESFMALDGISFDVKKGERIGIIGHNGAGKSTLLKLISRVTAPTTGKISLNGRVACMLEVGTGFHGELTGRENIYMNGAILGMRKKEIDDKIESIIAFSECRQFIDTPVKRYSSGMYVKLAFSVASHLDSEIMIMDEVLAVGDMAFQKKCLEKMSDVSKEEGRTILYVSHNMNTIRQLCNRCIVLDRGHLVFDGSVEKGISCYLNTAITVATEVDLSRFKRLSYLQKKDARFLYAKYPQRETNVFEREETIFLELRWINNKEINNLGLRIVIYDSQETHLCATFCYDFYSGKKGEKCEVKLKLDFSCLSPGNYQSYYVFFTINEYGGNEDIDQVRGLDFTIDDPKGVGKLAWRTDAWGHFELPPPMIMEMRNI
ncbi:MAG: ATP-binding cassette domain-containing protein [Blautia sp.]|nr:ATP-binding cassette domain-containing protein [Blautia sp.]